MVKRIGSNRRKMRHILRHNYRTRGKVSVSRALQEFADGQQVTLVGHPSVLQGRYFRRFHGWHGHIIGKLGRCYEVQVRDGNNQKVLRVHPIHLQKVQ